MTCALGTSLGSADSTPSTSVQMMISDASSRAPKMDPEKSLPLRPSVVCMPGVVVATNPVTMRRPSKSAGTSLRRFCSLEAPLHRRAERPPLDDDDLARIDPQHIARDAPSLAQERREQPRRPKLAIARDDVAHGVRRRPDEAYRLQHAARCRGNPHSSCSAIGLVRRARQQFGGELLVPSLQLLDGRRDIALGTLRQRHQIEQRIGDAAARRQDDGLARVRRRFDDVGNAPEAARVGDARAAELMYDPFIHISHAPHPARRSAPSHECPLSR